MLIHRCCPPLPPLKYGARFAFYRFMSELYGSAAAAASFDLAAQMSEGGVRSLNGLITTETLPPQLWESPSGPKNVSAFAKPKRTKKHPKNSFLPSCPVGHLCNSAPFVLRRCAGSGTRAHVRPGEMSATGVREDAPPPYTPTPPTPPSLPFPCAASPYTSDAGLVLGVGGFGSVPNR